MIKTAQQVLAENVGLLRNAADHQLSQAEIAERAGFDQTTVGRVLAMKNAPSVDKLDGLAKAFNVQPWQLLQPGFHPGAGPMPATFSPMAVELARAFETLHPSKQAALYAVAQAMLNPEPAAIPVASR